MLDTKDTFQKILASKRAALHRNQIEQEAARRALNDIVAVVSKLQIEVDAWEQAAKVATGEIDEIEFEEPDAALSPDSQSHSDQRRGPRGVWAELMPAVLEQRGEGEFRASDVAAIAASLEQEVLIDTIRVQMSNYVKRGWLNRVNLGVFEFSPEGRDIFQNIAKQNRFLREHAS